MDELGNGIDEILKNSVDDIYKKLKSDKVIENIGMKVLASMKDTVAYKQIRDIVLRQFLNLASNNLNAVVELKRKQIESATIGYFAAIVCSDLTKVIQSRLNKEYRPVFTNTVKKVSRCRPIRRSNKKFSAGNGASLRKAKRTERKGSGLKKQATKNCKDFQSQTKPRKQIFKNLESISRGYAQNLQDIHNNVKRTDTGIKHFQSAENIFHNSNSMEANCIPEDLKENAASDPSDSDYEINEGKPSNITKSNAFSLENQRLLNNEFENFMENIEIKQEPVSDEESELSFELHSDDSVSSVHTSDLSSFDDTISISSEDEMGNKKRKLISFQDAKKLYLDDKIPSSSQVKKLRTQNQEEFHSIQFVDSKIPHKAEEVGYSEDVTHKSLPQRMRKPNSKYS